MTREEEPHVRRNLGDMGGAMRNYIAQLDIVHLHFRLTILTSAECRARMTRICGGAKKEARPYHFISDILETGDI